MKAIPLPLQEHLDGGATTMSYCWRVTRRDGLVQGFTEHDEDLTFDGTTFIARSGFTATQVQQTLGLSIDNLNIEGALSSESINEDDLAAGRYDDAYVELFWVNWADVSQRILYFAGNTGEAKRSGIAFSAELRGLTHRLNQPQGRTFQRTCDAVVGDARCKVDLNLPQYKGTGVITQALTPRILRASGLGSFETDWFARGIITFVGGPNDGIRVDVKEHSKTEAGVVTVEMWYPPAFNIAVGMGFTITAGCKQTHGVCQAKFSNIVNFQGFPFIPGNDTLTSYPNQGGSNQSGDSLGKG